MFRELYYLLIQTLKKVKTNDNPAFNAYIGISFFQGYNLLSFLIVIRYFFSVNIEKDLAIILGIFLWLSITVFNYFTLYQKRNDIVKTFDHYSNRWRTRGNFALWTYMILTNLAFFYLAFNFVKRV